MMIMSTTNEDSEIIDIKAWRDRVGIGYESCDQFEAMTDEITELRAALAEAEKDAARYRWLKKSDWYIGPDEFFCDEAGGMVDYDNMNLGTDYLDEEIDQAMQKGE